MKKYSITYFITVTCFIILLILERDCVDTLSKGGVLSLFFKGYHIPLRADIGLLFFTIFLYLQYRLTKFQNVGLGFKVLTISILIVSFLNLLPYLFLSAFIPGLAS